MHDRPERFDLVQFDVLRIGSTSALHVTSIA
jgi:hypothetical protein